MHMASQGHLQSAGFCLIRVCFGYLLILTSLVKKRYLWLIGEEAPWNLGRPRDLAMNLSIPEEGIKWPSTSWEA